MEDSINKILMQEFKLTQMIREAYFEEYKEFIALGVLSKKIMGLRKYFTTHFLVGRMTPYHFKQFKIFQIEQWCKKNLPNHFKQIHGEISKWREKNDDNSVDVIQDTPLKRIAYDLLILHHQQKDEIINIKDLDNILRNAAPSKFPLKFFTRRLGEAYSFFVFEENMIMLKDIIKNNYDMKKKETKQIIKEIDEYIDFIIKIEPKSALKSHSAKFIKVLYPFQMKQIIDITKGLDPVLCEFFENLTKATRHHNDEDGMYDYIIYMYDDGGTTKYKFKLVPLGFLTSHAEIHKSLDGLSGMANDVVEARMRHLFDLYQLEYDDSIPEEDYFEIFKEKFRSRQDYIFFYKSNMNIWSEFGDGKVKGMTEKVIKVFVNRWIDSKKMSEQRWYEYYKKFYKEKYLPFIKRINEYIIGRSKGTIIASYEWFLYTYLPNEGLFSYKSAHPFDKYI